MAPVIQDVDDIDGTTPQDGEEYQAGTTAADDGNDEIGSELMHKISDRIDLIARNVGVLLRYTFVPMVVRFLLLQSLSAVAVRNRYCFSHDSYVIVNSYTLE
jgi:hypothetical protein